MDPLTTYTVTGLNTTTVWEFKYNLKGLLIEFKLLEGELNEKQITWLFHKDRFPYSELKIKGWSAIANLQVEIGQPDLTFDVFWNLYNHKIKKVDTERAWGNLSHKKRTLAISYIKTYDGYLRRKGVAKVNPHRYITKIYWEDNHGSIH